MRVEMEGPLSHEEYCSAVEAEMGWFVKIVEGADPATDVPTCPGWTIARLLKHVGITQRWAEHIVRHRVRERVPPREVPLTLPDDDRGYPGWLAEGAKSLVTTLREAAPDTPMWSWGADQHARFWSRRMLHEGTVHRADAEIALGREPRIDVRTATDGIDEFFSSVSAAPWIAERMKQLRGSGQTLHFHATDVDGGAGEWMVTVGLEGFTWEHGHAKGDVAVRGTASDLVLLVYGRFEPHGGRFEVFGDEDLLTRWRVNTAI